MHLCHPLHHHYLNLIGKVHNRSCLLLELSYLPLCWCLDTGRHLLHLGYLPNYQDRYLPIGLDLLGIYRLQANHCIHRHQYPSNLVVISLWNYPKHQGKNLSYLHRWPVNHHSHLRPCHSIVLHQVGKHLLRAYHSLRHRNMVPCIRHHLCRLQVQPRLGNHLQALEDLQRYPGIDPSGRLPRRHQYPSEQGYIHFRQLINLDLNLDKGRLGHLFHHHQCQLPSALQNNHQCRLRY